MQTSTFVGKSEHGNPYFPSSSNIVGAGFVHVLKRERTPAPHVAEHELH
jgi:hypothetical protein